MNPYLVFVVFGAIIAALWFFAWLDPDRRIREAFEAAQVRMGDDVVDVWTETDPAFTPLFDAIAAVQADELVAEAEAVLREAS